MKKICVIGAGAFGHSLTLMLHRYHSFDFVLYDINEEWIKHLQDEKKHPVFHKDQEIESHVSATTNLKEAVEGADMVVFAVPAQFMRSACENAKKYVGDDVLLLSLAKGIEVSSKLVMSDVIREYFPMNPLAALGGGMLALDLVHDLPLGATVGCTHREFHDDLATLFSGTCLHVDVISDVVGVEYAGAFKNVLAIGAGYCDGKGFGGSTKAFYVLQLARELTCLAVKLGSHPTTFEHSYSWIGDVLTTAYGNSRNRWFGELLGEGKTREDIMSIAKLEHKTVEGVPTLQVVNDLIEDSGVDAPYLKRLHAVVFEGLDSVFVED